MTSQKFEILKRIYALYDETVLGETIVCQKGCASCCTCNVTLTGLEAAYPAEVLETEAKTALKKSIDRHFPENRFIPKITTNQFARLCMEGKPVAEEENDPAWGKCPALQDEVCSIYAARPFGCRALISQILCSDRGYARVPPEILTINTVFMQAIEHLDQNGISGNFSDIIPLFADGNTPENDQQTQNNRVDKIRRKIQNKGSARFSANEKITVLMIEPKYREKLSPIVQKLSTLLAVRSG